MKTMKEDLRTFSDSSANIYQEIKLECVSETFQKCYKECFDFLDSTSKDLLCVIREGVSYRINILSPPSFPHSNPPDGSKYQPTTCERNP